VVVSAESEFRLAVDIWDMRDNLVLVNDDFLAEMALAPLVVELVLGGTQEGGVVLIGNVPQLHSSVN
jgi:hypothetical protein